jgi:hypothetical protein
MDGSFFWSHTLDYSNKRHLQNVDVTCAKCDRNIQ